MKKDATLIYSWQVEGAADPRDFHFDQHGHTTPAAGEAMSVATYRQAVRLEAPGALTRGPHGRQFPNSSRKPVVVKLRLAGFYELIPAGRPGNEAGIVANVPAAQAR